MASKKTPRLNPTKKCHFCQSKTEPKLSEYEVLNRFLSERGKILSRQRGGTCAKHQRKLGREIKRARYLALLP